MSGTLPVHGGDLAAIGRRYGVDPSQLLDFSANLNPLGPPAALLRELEAAARDVDGLARYPEPDGRILREAVGAHTGIAPEAIAIGNGAAALLAAALGALGARRAIVPTPAFSEDRHAARLAGAECFGVALDSGSGYAFEPGRVLDAIEGPGDVVLVTNPHNPTGNAIAREPMLAFVASALERGAAAIVDEAFVDYVPEIAITSDAAKRERFVSIRSLTKFYAVPALRVGYAVAHPALATIVAERLPSWPVTSLASRAVAAALGDLGYAHRTLSANARARDELVAGLRSLGCAVVPPAANYLFVTLPATAPSASEFAAALVRDARIVVRDCSSYEGLEAGRHVRVAIRSTGDNRRLLAAFAAALDEV